MDPQLHPRLLAWVKDDLSDPDRPSLDNPDVQRLIARIAPHSLATDLGGVMSLNARLDAAEVVLRVHQPFVSRVRLLAEQQVRRTLANRGLVVPIALSWHKTTVMHCGKRWAEIEKYIPHQRMGPTLTSYSWLFQAMGTLHRTLAECEDTVPRPLYATYASPSTLRRWVSVTQASVQGDGETADIARFLYEQIKRLRKQWLPASHLPQQLIHGDVRLSNVCQTLDGQTVYFDFGFSAYRPRIHDLAYALAFMVFALQGNRTPAEFPWQSISELIEAYEATANWHLTTAERKALAPYTASVPLFAAALDGFTNDPARQLQNRLPFLRLSEWLLTHPEVVLR